MGLCELGDNNILYTNSSKEEITLEGAKEYIRILREDFGFSEQNPARVLIRAKPGSKEVRDYLADPETAKTSKALVLVIKSSIAKIAVNLFIKFSKPMYPTKAFSNEGKAVEWLLSIK